MMKRSYLLIATLAALATGLITACNQTTPPSGNAAVNTPPANNTPAVPAGDPAAAVADNSGIGDVVMSVLGQSEFRRNRGDNGPNYKWYLADGKDFPQPVGGLTKIDFQGRYPRGASEAPVPNLVEKETGAVGTIVGQAIKAHSHTTTWGMSGFDNDGDPSRKAAVFQGANFGNGTEVTNESGGGAETRPNSVVMYFYIRVR